MRSSSRVTHEQKLAAYAEWEWHYGQVEAFVRERGHCNLGEHPAGDWLGMQLQMSTAGKLSLERQERLAGLGVSLDAGDAVWKEALKGLRKVLRQSGVPRKKIREQWLPEPQDGYLAHWLREQRAKHQADLLPADLLHKLMGMMLISAKREPKPLRSSSRLRLRTAEEQQAWEARQARKELRAQQRREAQEAREARQARKELRAQQRREAQEAREARQARKELRAQQRREAQEAREARRVRNELKAQQRREAREARQALKELKAKQRREAREARQALKELKAKQRQEAREARQVLKAQQRREAAEARQAQKELKAQERREVREARQAVLWEARFAELVAYHHEQGDCDVPKHWPENRPLANWVRNQRLTNRRGKMTEDRRARLDALGFQWSLRHLPVDRRWERRFQQLVEFKNQHGHTRVPMSQGKAFWSWRHVQRDFRRKGLLHPERIARLEAIDFEWEEQGKPFAKSREERWERQWEEMFGHLVEFQREHGTAHVVAGWKENPRLGTWVGDQRELERHGRLRPDRKARLDAIGFVWNAENVERDARWERHFQQLLAFKEQHGHTRVPGSFDKPLWSWRHIQRDCRRRGVLNAERVARLEAIGFEWEEEGKPFAKSREERWDLQWDAMYKELVEFKRQHGTTHVVATRPGNSRLAHWMGVQRELKKEGSLRPDRQARLDAIGFLWKPGRLVMHERWEKRYAELVAFKEQHGHTRVPKSYDKAFWSWKHIQRDQRRRGILSAERIARLEAIGFEWEEADKPLADTREKRWDLQWEAMFEQLLEQQRQQGTAQITVSKKKNARLAEWVSSQRDLKKRGNLRPDRQARLEAVGFQWSKDSGNKAR